MRGKNPADRNAGQDRHPSEPDHLSVLVCTQSSWELLCKVYLTSAITATFLSWLMKNIPPEPRQSAHSLKERNSHTMPVCFLFPQLPEQGVPGSARLYHTGDSTVDVTNMASGVQEWLSRERG